MRSFPTSVKQDSSGPSFEEDEIVSIPSKYFQNYEKAFFDLDPL